MRLFRGVFVFGFALVVSWGAASDAWAALWAAPVGDARIVAAYEAKLQSGTHRGVDLGASESTPVRAPASGRVFFAGAVPADGGGTCGAVTIETADGSKISLLPLEALHVTEGQDIEAGHIVGRLAGSGDDSHSGAHLHVGLRVGGLYVDPTPLLPVPREPASVSTAVGAPGAPNSPCESPGGIAGGEGATASACESAELSVHTGLSHAASPVALTSSETVHVDDAERASEGYVPSISPQPCSAALYVSGYPAGIGLIKESGAPATACGSVIGEPLRTDAGALSSTVPCFSFRGLVPSGLQGAAQPAVVVAIAILGATAACSAGLAGARRRSAFGGVRG